VSRRSWQIIALAAVFLYLGLIIGARIERGQSEFKVNMERIEQGRNYNRIMAERDFMRSVLTAIDPAWKIREDRP
jgi:hypothetical protein